MGAAACLYDLQHHVICSCMSCASCLPLFVQFILAEVLWVTGGGDTVTSVPIVVVVVDSSG